MNSLKNFRIGTRLGVGFAGIVGLLIAMAALGINRIDAVDTNTEVIVHDRYVKIALAHSLENEVNKQARALRTALIAGDAAVVKSELDKVGQSVPVITKTIETLERVIHTEKGKLALKAMLEARKAFIDREHDLLEMIKNGKVNEGRAYLVKELLPLQGVYLASIEAFAETQVQGMEQFGAEAAEMTHSTHTLMLSLTVVATLLAGMTGFLLTRSITGPITEAVKVAETVAAGDLSSRIEVQGRDETAQLLMALKTMNTSLVKVVGAVRAGSDSIATGSSQIATGNADLSQRTEEQASNLQQTAASMEQLSSTVKTNADIARQATQLATSASAVAAKGGEVVGQVVSTMNDIAASSKKISDIIGVIDGIAFQTNILALNAAVEAARAGEQGRGFAVVAAEVRGLAQRSAGAAKEIKSLIGASVERVQAGSRLVDDAGATMDDIVAQVRKVADMIGEISIATAEQTTGIGQVGHAVTQLDVVTQQNAALVEESAAAADSLSRQAQKLVEAVSVFRLGAQGEPAFV